MQVTTTAPAFFFRTTDPTSRQAAPSPGQAETPIADCCPNEPCPWCGSVRGFAEDWDGWERCYDCGGN